MTEITRKTHYKVEIPCKKKGGVIFNKTWTGTIKRIILELKKKKKQRENKCSFWVEIFLEFFFFFFWRRRYDNEM